MEYIEVTGRTIDDALTNACLKLETTSDNIEYEVIEKGSNGLFGIFNSKPTKIKARVKAGVGSVDDEFSKRSQLMTQSRVRLRPNLRKKLLKRQKRLLRKKQLLRQIIQR